MQAVLGTVLACSRFGCVVRLEDGRLASLPAGAPGLDEIRRAAIGRRRPQFSFVVEEQVGRRTRVGLAPDRDRQAAAPTLSATSSLEEKIIDYLRQTAEWDPDGRIAERAQAGATVRGERLLPFELRARRQYRESAKRPPRPKR